MKPRFDRAAFLAGATAVAGAALLPVPGRGQAPAAGRIDVHRHLSPPFYQDAIKGKYQKPFPPPLASWTPDRCLADMDAAGIEMGILSMPARPGMYFGDPLAARTFCRQCNDYMASLRDAHRGRLGFFAALPLPDVEGSLIEVAYAFDKLRANGAGGWSNYEGKYLGDAMFAPLWAELDRRKAVMFVHATDAPCCANPVPQMSETVVEFAADTTRTIGSLVFSGTSERYPGIRFVFSHGGGMTPFVVDRFINEAADPHKAQLFPQGVQVELKRFFYDTAFVSSPEGMAALMRMVPPAHVVLGTDYPYAAGKTTTDQLVASGIGASAIAAIGRQSAVALLSLSA